MGLTGAQSGGKKLRQEMGRDAPQFLWCTPFPAATSLINLTLGRGQGDNGNSPKWPPPTLLQGGGRVERGEQTMVLRDEGGHAS